MQLDAKKFFFAFFFFIATLITLGYYHFNHEQKLINQNINTTLEQAVKSASILIGDRYQERVLAAAPSAVDDADTINALTSLAHTQGVENLYSLILDNRGNLHFTSSSARNHGLTSSQILTHFYDIYPMNPGIIKALKSNKIIWDTKEQSDQTVKYRSLYIPYTTPSGLHYVIGADIEVGSIKKLSNAAAFKSIATSFIVFLGALPFLLIYRNTLQGTASFLRAKVRSATDELREVNEILETKVEEKTKQLISQSFEDPLTGLPNRHRLQYDMDRHSYKALIIINLQNFREINDFFGFAIGDNLLKQMGQWLQALDFSPYRLSGDEFAILFEEELTQEALEMLCERLVHRLMDHPFSVGEESVSLSVTIGIDAEPEVSLTHADIALHQAKENSTHIAFYSGESHIEEQYKANIALTSTIHKALNAGRITCFYQPIVSTQSGRIEKYETLVRMIDESANIIPPLDFLKTAQKTRLYPQITRTVVEHACNTFKNRNEEFSVNLSIRDILDPGTVRFIEETIVQTDTAHRIVFEILESEGIDNFDAVTHFIHRMKKLGSKIAIDDYGTGYSSLENILRLDVDYIKIDGSLIRNINTDPKHAIVLNSIADFASKLGIKTIAEYVESEEIFNHIKSIDITYSQGYYTGKPTALSI
ncbi:MAG: bifunctional diguanylate cyclase/phosphodiesterase [Sulfuricurvum sp.]|uniref:putative bifunctional diguanylate cyclase/phosphodiesterase n=1 Tax=Sulfuricurvum sp. TaxID=2025608 RepID=UPI002625F94A|nr:bifunctional diguanylate cyclase/phosphodiesterase [Sulfuricurvum sp.]MDD2369400.1 bifunctional diguanylate cyclase/phosphodiesterase [Sulfuricurvum sp.]MDD2950271.1 bifunctional diguanylate cyclase/phosphodiesterase [Sulfuricurvum sp.]MDD5119430.1 bifunctional diguanylate cyclase/phosphodiesterase [Sulfuricurvum sp.]